MKRKIMHIIVLIAVITTLFPAAIGFAANENGPWGGSPHTRISITK